MAAADTGEEGLSCYTGVAVSAAAAEVHWLAEERFELKGFCFALSASKCDGLKLEVLSATGELFIGAWDVEAQVVAGFGRRADAESRLKMMRNALSGHPSMTTTLTAAGSELKLEIKVPVADYFAVEIEFCMRRAEDCQSLSPWLRQLFMDWKAAQRQLTGSHSDTRNVELLKEIASLKVAMTKAASDSGAIVEELRETNAKMEEEFTKAKAHAAAEHRSAEQMLAEAKKRILVALKKTYAAKMEELCETNTTIEQKLAAATKELTAARSQISDEPRDLSAAKKRSDIQIAEMSKEIESLKSALAKSKEEMAEAISHIGAIFEECHATERRATAAKERSDAQISQLSKEILLLKSQLAKSKSQNTKLSKEKAQATAVRRTAEQRLVKARTKFAAAKKEMESLKSALAEMTKANAHAAAEHRSAEQMLAEAKAESDRRAAELKAAMAEAASDSGAIIEELKEANAKSKATLIDVKTQATAECRAAEQKLAKAQKSIVRLKRRKMM